MKYFFASDHHFGSKGVIRHDKRPFTDTKHMEEELVARHNSVVGPNDMVYLLGDLGFNGRKELARIIRKMKGRKVWVPGNHCQGLLKGINEPHSVLRPLFEDITPLVYLKVPDPDHARGMQDIMLCHFPMLTWNKAHHKSWMLHGHSHGNLRYPIPNQRILDVGVCCHDYTPISYEQVKEYMSTRGFDPVDHHEEGRHDAD